MTWTENPTEIIERAFNAIAKNGMADFPLVNAALCVEAINCQAYRFADGINAWLTALITPWSMNLMLLPAADGETPWPATAPGGKYRWRFPSGVYEFTVAKAQGLGLYHLCSLFSPPTEFASQQIARQTAYATLSALTTALTTTPAQEEEKRQRKHTDRPIDNPVNITNTTNIADKPVNIHKRRLFLGLEGVGNLKKGKA